MKTRYKILENKNLGTHSFYAVAVPTGTLTFDDVCEEACDGKSVTPATMRMCVEEYMRAARRELLRGFRVPLGDQFLYLYPNIAASAKDTVDATGKVTKVATAEDVKLGSAVSRVGCSVSMKLSEYFAANVSWQRVDPITGAVIDDDPKTPTTKDGGSTTDDPTASGGATSDGDNVGGKTSGTSSDGKTGGTSDSGASGTGSSSGAGGSSSGSYEQEG